MAPPGKRGLGDGRPVQPPGISHPGQRPGESRLARPKRGAVVNLRIALDLVVAAVASREDELVESMIRRNAAEVPDLGLAR